MSCLLLFGWSALCTRTSFVSVTAHSRPSVWGLPLRIYRSSSRRLRPSSLFKCVASVPDTSKIATRLSGWQVFERLRSLRTSDSQRGDDLLWAMMRERRFEAIEGRISCANKSMWPRHLPTNVRSSICWTIVFVRMLKAIKSSAVSTVLFKAVRRRRCLSRFHEQPQRRFLLLFH